MQTTKLSLVLLASFLVACGGRNIGDNNNNVTPPDNLTRRTLLEDSMELMGYDIDLGPGCVSPAEDVFPNVFPEDERLCWALKKGIELELIAVDMTGDFRPEDTVNHAEMWRFITSLMGYAALPPDGQNIPASDIDPDTWYAQYALSLIITRNWQLVFVDENGHANPSNPTTSLEWFQAKQLFQNELLAGSPTREHIFEMITSIFYDSRYTEIPCQGSIFPDATNNDMLCYTSTLLADEGIVQGYPDGWLHPYDTIYWGEIFKLIVLASGLDASVATGCSGTDPGYWYAGYADAVCDAIGGLPEYVVVADNPSKRNEVLQVMFAVRAATSSY